MIPIEVLKQVQVIYTHGKCPDGMASAMILKDAFKMLGMEPQIVFLVHGTEAHRQAGLTGRALFCDIVPTAGVADMATIGPHVVLDHHIGAESIVAQFGDLGVFAHEKEQPGVSGAVLAYREVWLPVRTYAAAQTIDWTFQPETAVRDFAECTGVRDTWQTKDPRFLRGQWGSKVLMSKPASHWLNHRYPDGSGAPTSPQPFLTEGEIAQGRALFEAHEEAVRQARDQIVVLTNGGKRIAVFQEQATGARLTSDLAELLRTEQPLGELAALAGFSFVVDNPGGVPRLLYSLRSLGDFDVCAFAKANGGSGHTKAAGFSTELTLMNLAGPYHDIADRFCAYLESHADPQ